MFFKKNFTGFLNYDLPAVFILTHFHEKTIFIKRWNLAIFLQSPYPGVSFIGSPLKNFVLLYSAMNQRQNSRALPPATVWKSIIGVVIFYDYFAWTGTGMKQTRMSYTLMEKDFMTEYLCSCKIYISFRVLLPNGRKVSGLAKNCNNVLFKLSTYLSFQNFFNFLVLCRLIFIFFELETIKNSCFQAPFSVADILYCIQRSPNAFEIQKSQIIIFYSQYSFEQIIFFSPWSKRSLELHHWKYISLPIPKINGCIDFTFRTELISKCKDFQVSL